MTLYEVALFVHILGVIGAFVGLGIEWEGRARLRKADHIEQVEGFERLGGTLRVLQTISGVAILAAGLYMTLSAWGFEPWILTGLTGLVLLVVLGAITGQRTATLTLADEGSSVPAAGRALSDPFIRASLHLRTGIAIGVVFVMVTKPGVAGALATMGVAVGVSFTPNIRAWFLRRRSKRATSQEDALRARSSVDERIGRGR